MVAYILTGWLLSEEQLPDILRGNAFSLSGLQLPDAVPGVASERFQPQSFHKPFLFIDLYIFFFLNRFHINLKFHGGTAFQFNPRFDENVIVRNSHLNNSCGKEERQLPNFGMCFCPGQNFEVRSKKSNLWFSQTFWIFFLDFGILYPNDTGGNTCVGMTEWRFKFWVEMG